MKTFSRYLGNICLGIAAIGALSVVAMLGVSQGANCSMNWYGFDCPEWSRWLSVVGALSIFIAPLLAILGYMLRRMGRS